MRTITKLGFVLAVLSLITVTLSSWVAEAQVDYKPPHEKPGPAVDRIYYRAIPMDEAGHALRRGDIDFYAFNLGVATAMGLKGAPGIRLYEAPALTNALILNPAPAPPGLLNPLAIPEIRQALQLVVDRDFIAQELFRGMAKPMKSFVTPYDFDYLIAAEVIREKGIRYAPDLARDRISKAMKEAGAVFRDGRWYYGDKPVVLKFVIRTEDERRHIGDAISSELEKLGFSVERLYRDFGPAISLVYGSDPAALGWHLYTEGWVTGVAVRWDDTRANQFAAPWFGRMPGWQEAGFWQFENPKADEIGKRLSLGKFKDVEERNALYREIIRISLEDSVRIWLVTVTNAFLTSDQLIGVTEDIAAGPRNLWTPRTAYIPGRDTLRIGNLHVWTASSFWNTVDGLRDLYSRDIWNNLWDPAMWRHPGSAQPMPFRATYKVETAGPEGKLPVPEDAFIWDAAAREFRKVAPGTTATSKVTVDLSRYFQSRWHHGQPITLADLVYSLYYGSDIAYNPRKAEIETSVAARLKPFLETLRGYRILDDRRLEVYVDYWHFDKDHIAEYATGFPSTPWEMDAATDHLVFTQRRAAYSETAGKRFGVPTLSLVLKDHVALVRSALLELRDQRFVPEPLRGSGPVQITPEEAVARYEAALKWIEERGLAVISNGPFRLVRFDPAAQFAELEAFRDPTYPFKPKDWYYGSLKRVDFARIDLPTVAVGAEAKVSIKLEGPEPLHLRYTLLEAGTDRVITKGEAKAVTATDFAITLPAELTAKLLPGLYQFHLIGYSDKLASPTERLVEFTIGVAPGLPTPTPPPPGLPRSTLIYVIIGLLGLTAFVVLLLWRRRQQTTEQR